MAGDCFAVLCSILRLFACGSVVLSVDAELFYRVGLGSSVWDWTLSVDEVIDVFVLMFGSNWRR